MSFKEKLRFCSHFRQKKDAGGHWVLLDHALGVGYFNTAVELIMIKYKYKVEALMSAQPQEGKLELATYKM